MASVIPGAPAVLPVQQQILAATAALTPSLQPAAAPVAIAAPGAHMAAAMPASALEQRALIAGIPLERLRLAQAVGAARLRALQDAAQQQLVAAYAQQVAEAQQLHEKHQEAAQLALIMEAAEAQAEFAKQVLEDDKEDHDWRRKARTAAICGNWTRGYCKHGDACQFSHPEREFGSSTTKRGPADLMRYNFKTAVCRLFSTGTCAHGARCMFAHGPAELRSPGMPLSRDEEDMVQRVAAGGKRNKESATTVSAGSTQSSGIQPAAAPTVAQQVATAQMIALAGHAAASMPTLPGLPSNAADLPLDTMQQRALEGLKGLGLDPSTLDMIGNLAKETANPLVGDDSKRLRSV